MLALYTDGLIENDRDLQKGERALVNAVRAISEERHEDVAAAILTRTFDGAGNRDDAAVLTLSRLAPRCRGTCSRRYRRSRRSPVRFWSAS